MKRRAALIFYLLFLLVFARQANGQFLKPPVNITSPNASTLWRFDEIPISLFTGLPSIHIPLHTFTQGDLQIPITLSYHASGVQLDQHPGWTGLNWNLSAGGAISRKINDKPDEAHTDNPEIFIGGPRAGYYYNHKVTNPTNAQWDTKAYIISLINGVDQVIMDKQPDEFTFSFLNYSGKFYLDHEGKWISKGKCSTQSYV